MTKSKRDLGFEEDPVAGTLHVVLEHLEKSRRMAAFLATPYDSENRTWVVDVGAMEATHRDSGFVMRFTRHKSGGFVASLANDLPAFGPDSKQAIAQFDGLQQLLRDGWESWHTAVAKQAG